MKTMCAIYARSATPDNRALKRQEQVGVKLCKRNGWDYRIFRDIGSGNAAVGQRAAMQELLAAVAKNQIHYCFVTELNRFSRRLVTLRDILEVFARTGVVVVTHNQTLDPHDGKDRLTLEMLVSFGEYSRG